MGAICNNETWVPGTATGISRKPNIRITDVSDVWPFTITVEGTVDGNVNGKKGVFMITLHHYILDPGVRHYVECVISQNTWKATIDLNKTHNDDGWGVQPISRVDNTHPMSGSHVVLQSARFITIYTYAEESYSSRVTAETAHPFLMNTGLKSERLLIPTPIVSSYPEYKDNTPKWPEDTAKVKLVTVYTNSQYVPRTFIVESNTLFSYDIIYYDSRSRIVRNISDKQLTNDNNYANLDNTGLLWRITGNSKYQLYVIVPITHRSVSDGAWDRLYFTLSETKTSVNLQNQTDEYSYPTFVKHYPTDLDPSIVKSTHANDAGLNILDNGTMSISVNSSVDIANLTFSPVATVNVEVHLIEWVNNIEVSKIISTGTRSLNVNMVMPGESVDTYFLDRFQYRPSAVNYTITPPPASLLNTNATKRAYRVNVRDSSRVDSRVFTETFMIP